MCPFQIAKFPTPSSSRCFTLSNVQNEQNERGTSFDGSCSTLDLSGVHFHRAWTLPYYCATVHSTTTSTTRPTEIDGTVKLYLPSEVVAFQDMVFAVIVCPLSRASSWRRQRRSLDKMVGLKTCPLLLPLLFRLLPLLFFFNIKAQLLDDPI